MADLHWFACLGMLLVGVEIPLHQWRCAPMLVCEHARHCVHVFLSVHVCHTPTPTGTPGFMCAHVHMWCMYVHDCPHTAVCKVLSRG